MNKIIVICGPTASGKSSLAINLAKKLKTEIISADSLAIYKNLDIGTAKPSKEELKEIKHHLINVCEPTDTFCVHDYEALALPIVNRLLQEGKTPIICGGTGFYINSILYNLSYGKTSENLEIRNKYKLLAEKYGAEYVYEELKKVDIESYNKLHANDLVRVIRALEIYYTTGKKKSEQNDLLTPRFNYDAYMIKLDRNILYDRINNRVDKMFENGLVDEVKNLIEMGITLDNQCMQGIGYKEVYEGIKNNTLEGAKELIKLNSRHYAKRQITFFKRLSNLQYINLTENTVNDILSNL